MLLSRRSSLWSFEMHSRRLDMRSLAPQARSDETLCTRRSMPILKESAAAPQLVTELVEVDDGFHDAMDIELDEAEGLRIAKEAETQTAKEGLNRVQAAGRLVKRYTEAATEQAKRRKVPTGRGTPSASASAAAAKPEDARDRSRSPVGADTQGKQPV